MKDIALRSDFPLSITEQMQTAKALAQAGVLPSHLRQQPANIMAIGMASRALDIPTWTALQQVVPIDGKVTIQADLMRALILRAGHKFRVEHADANSATCVVIRSDDPDYPHRVTVTYDEIPDELKRKTNWRNYTADMLVARCTAKVARRSCSDVLNGMIYTPDELGADVNDDGEVTTVPQEGTAAAQRATSAAERLRAAADAEASRHGAQEPTQPAADDVVDAEVVEDGPAEQQPAEQPAGDAAVETPQQPTDETFPASQGEPFGESTNVHDDPAVKAAMREAVEVSKATPAADPEDLSEAANRPTVRDSGLRRGLLAEAENRWGADYAQAVTVAMEGIPLEKVTNDELKSLLFAKAS